MRIHIEAIWLAWACGEIPSLTTGSNPTCGHPRSRGFIKQSFTCWAISDGKWRPPFKTARGTRQAKYNYLMWFQQTSLTVMARGLQGSAAPFAASASSSAVCQHPFLPTRWREHFTLSRQHRSIKLLVLTGTRRPPVMQHSNWDECPNILFQVMFLFCPNQKGL